MPNKHQSKFWINLISGLALISLGTLSILYGSFAKEHHTDWLFFGLVALVSINGGLLLFGSAIVHKVKADLINRDFKRKRKEKIAIEEEL